MNNTVLVGGGSFAPSQAQPRRVPLSIDDQAGRAPDQIEGANTMDNGVVIPGKHIQIIGTYKLTAREYVAKHQPTLIGATAVGRWYAHPTLGAEVGLLVVITGTNRIHATGHMDVPTDDELGVRITRV